mgnify:CR=1 FL=1
MSAPAVTAPSQAGFAAFLQFVTLAGLAAMLVFRLQDRAPAGHWGYWALVAGFWLFAWDFNRTITSGKGPFARAADWLAPLIFGTTLLMLWEAFCVGFGVPTVLLPAPSLIADRMASSMPMLAADFVQTIIRAALPGWIMGCLLGFLVALACDRSDFLRRGLMPIGNFISALPIIGIAPILVMWLSLIHI